VEAILTRQNIRKYTDQPVSDDLVTQVLRAAMAAPSAGNQQPWQFIVVRDRDSLEAISTASPYSEMARDAQVAVVVCGDLTREERSGYWMLDCAAATENLLVAANSLGLGALWLYFYPRHERIDALRALLDLPQQIIPFAVVPIGYPAEDPAQVDPFRPELVHFERW